MTDDLYILMLEDDPGDAELIQRFLTRSGFKLRSMIAFDKESYIRAIATDTFDVILADNSLPQFNSSEALLLLQEQGLDTPFILVTGTVSEEFAVTILHQGADDYILKNNLSRLPSSISSAREKRRNKQEKLVAEFERQKAEEELRKSEEKYRLLFEGNPMSAWVIDNHQDTILAVNEAAVRHYGYSKAEFTGMPIGNILPHSAGGHSGIAHHLKKDGSLMDAEMVSTDVSYENKSARLVLINDITLKLKAEREIEQMNRELRDLSSHLQNIREEERIQIARDIHDELGQQLTGLKMDMYVLEKQLQKGDSQLTGKFKGMMGTIDDIVKSVKRIAANLRPSLLDDFGLVPALQWQSQEVETRFGIQVLFKTNFTEGDIPAAISTGLFRIYQEALTNAVRHANAHVINTSLTMSDNGISMDIKDDGKGMDAASGSKKKSFGLLGIKERVFVMNGHYELHSEPGKGTHLRVSVPL
jgi:two-component system, NarL family, sensor histidine kinase UhpB